MNDFLNVTVLSVLQGVAEFLPVSSSGHLVIGQRILGVEAPGMRLDIFLHVGTLVAVFAYYAARVRTLLGAAAMPCVPRSERAAAWKYASWIFVSAVPAVAIYALFKAQVEALFENAKMVGALLMFTGAVLVITRYLPKGKEPLSGRNAFFMGCAQAVALLPGVSRSGMTLTAARICGMTPEASAEFSFLMSAPLIAGAALLQICRAAAQTAEEAAAEIPWSLTLWGAAVAAAVGYFSLAMLVRVLKGSHFWLFGPYCFIAGLLTLCFC